MKNKHVVMCASKGSLVGRFGRSVEFFLESGSYVTLIVLKESQRTRIISELKTFRNYNNIQVFVASELQSQRRGAISRKRASFFLDKFIDRIGHLLFLSYEVVKSLPRVRLQSAVGIALAIFASLPVKLLKRSKIFKLSNRSKTIKLLNRSKIFKLLESSKTLLRVPLIFMAFRNSIVKLQDRGNKFDLIYTCDFYPIGAGAKSKRDYKTLWVHDSHEFFSGSHGLSKLSKVFVRIVEKSLLPKADGLIVPNELLGLELSKNYNVDYFVHRNVTRFLSSSPSARTVRDFFSIPSHLPIFVYVGGLQEGRGLEDLVKIFIQSSFYLAIVGEGSLKKSLQETIDNYSNASVRILQPVSVHEVSGFISSADVGIIPYPPTSRNNEFSSPNKLFEYFNAGLAVLASNHGLFGSLGRDGIIATFNPKSRDSILLESSKFLNCEYLNQFKKQSKSFARDNSFEKESEKKNQFLKQILNNSQLNSL